MSRGGAFGAGTVHPFIDTYILLLSIQGASRSGEAPGWLNEAILMERQWIGTKPLPSDDLMGRSLSIYQAREIGDPTRKKYVYGSIDEVDD